MCIVITAEGFDEAVYNMLPLLSAGGNGGMLAKNGCSSTRELTILFIIWSIIGATNSAMAGSTEVPSRIAPFSCHTMSRL